MKRNLAVLLVALLALSLLAGCGQVGLVTPAVFTTGAAEEARMTDKGTGSDTDDGSALREGFFRPVASCQPGTAGASLKQAQAAFMAFAFANKLGTFDARPALVREQMQQAWDGLTQAERDAFDEYLPGVCSLLFDCFDDWEAKRPLFDDTGLAEAMDQLLAAPQAKANWMALVTYTLTIDRANFADGGEIIIDNDDGSIIMTPPTPTPTPELKPESVKVFFFEDEKEEFTLKVGEAVKLRAVAYPVDRFPNAVFKWSVSDESVIKLTVSADTRECEFRCLKHQPGGVTVTVECSGVTKEVKVYTKN